VDYAGCGLPSDRRDGGRPDHPGVRSLPAGDPLRFGPDLMGPLVCNLAGGLMILAAWVATSGQADLARQIPYVNLGAAGAILAGAGDAVFLLGCRRMVRRRIARVARMARSAVAGPGAGR